MILFFVFLRYFSMLHWIECFLAQHTLQDTWTQQNLCLLCYKLHSLIIHDILLHYNYECNFLVKNYFSTSNFKLFKHFYNLFVNTYDYA